MLVVLPFVEILSTSNTQGFSMCYVSSLQVIYKVLHLMTTGVYNCSCQKVLDLLQYQITL